MAEQVPRAATSEFAALQAVIEALQPLDEEVRSRIFQTAATFFRIDAPMGAPAPRVIGDLPEPRSVGPSYPAFSADTSMSPKEFLFEKQPRTDVERIAVLAYYLTHFREMPHFKTLDISKLNTEAAQPKFANAANSANNAVKQGYLVPSTKGQRQLSAAGERFVIALPDRDAARAAMAAAMTRRKPRRPSAAKAAKA